MNYFRIVVFLVSLFLVGQTAVSENDRDVEQRQDIYQLVSDSCAYGLLSPEFADHILNLDDVCGISFVFASQDDAYSETLNSLQISVSEIASIELEDGRSAFYNQLHDFCILRPRWPELDTRFIEIDERCDFAVENGREIPGYRSLETRKSNIEDSASEGHVNADDISRFYNQLDEFCVVSREWGALTFLYGGTESQCIFRLDQGYIPERKLDPDILKALKERLDDLDFYDYFFPDWMIDYARERAVNNAVLDQQMRDANRAEEEIDASETESQNENSDEEVPESSSDD